MKAAVVCLLLVVVATVSVESSVNQTRIMGSVKPSSRLLDREVAFVVGRKDMVLAWSFFYPKSGVISDISCIKVIDRWLNGTNGNLNIFSGGVEKDSVSMSILSQKGFGISYDIEIWGSY